MEHISKEHLNSFSAKYNCDKLVYFKWYSRIEDAIAEEKRIKGGSRVQKLNLINTLNPEWNDLLGIIKDN